MHVCRPEKERDRDRDRKREREDGERDRDRKRERREENGIDGSHAKVGVLPPFFTMCRAACACLTGYT